MSGLPGAARVVGRSRILSGMSPNEAGSVAAPLPASERPPAEAAVATQRVVIVMPAYNAAQTLERTYQDIPHEIIDRIILVDDVSQDETVDVAHDLGLDVIIHRQNLGYGGNQKTCYRAALEAGFSRVVARLTAI